MASRAGSTRLTAGELEIMQLLWERGPLSLKEAHAALGRDIGYTTMQTRLNRLVDKGVVRRSKHRPARYEAAVQPSDVSAEHLELLVERVGGGSVVPLVTQLVTDRSLSPDEIRELKRLIADAELASRGASAGKETGT